MNKLLNTLVLLMVALMWSSCRSTYDKAYKGVYTAYHKNKAGARDASLAIWPFQTKDSVSIQYLPGDSVRVPGPVLFVNCDSIASAAKAGNSKINSTRVQVPCPDGWLLRDTLKYYHQQFTEDTRKVDKAMDSIASLHRNIVAKEVAIANLTQDLKSSRRANMRLWMALGIAAAYFALRIVARFKFPFIYKFLP